MSTNTKFEKSYILYANEQYYSIVKSCVQSIGNISRKATYLSKEGLYLSLSHTHMHTHTLSLSQERIVSLCKSFLVSFLSVCTHCTKPK